MAVTSGKSSTPQMRVVVCQERNRASMYTSSMPTLTMISVRDERRPRTSGRHISAITGCGGWRIQGRESVVAMRIQPIAAGTSMKPSRRQGPTSSTSMPAPAVEKMAAMPPHDTATGDRVRIV